MKKLFVVTLTREVLVVADDATAAEVEARRERYAIESGEEPDITAVAMTYWPYGWEDDAIPYGTPDEEDPDRTVGEWVKLGAAPKLEK